MGTDTANHLALACFMNDGFSMLLTSYTVQIDFTLANLLLH